MKALLTIIFVLLINFGYTQTKKSENWSDNEIANYQTLKALAHYASRTEINKLSRDTLIKKYIYFDYVLKDTIESRKQERLKKLIPVFNYFKETVDSLGIENIDAKPIRFFKDHEIYKPFKKQLKALEPDVFAFYEKKNPNKPLRCLYFEKETNKLAAWILINQGGYRYFLLFNLL